MLSQHPRSGQSLRVSAVEPRFRATLRLPPPPPYRKPWVSTSEQADSGLGLEAQRRRITTACDERGWDLVAIHEDAGVSGAKSVRPGLRAALGALDDGAVEGLVVAKVDRLSRSLAHFTDLIEQSRKAGWTLVALDLGVDTSTASGEMIANTIANFAQFERRLIGERTRDALAVKKAEGTRLGRPPAIPDQVAQDIVSQRDAGATFQAIADDLNQRGVPTAHGGKSWYPMTVRNIFTRAADRVEAPPTRSRRRPQG